MMSKDQCMLGFENCTRGEMVNLVRVQGCKQALMVSLERVQGANTRANFGSLLINSNIES